MNTTKINSGKTKMIFDYLKEIINSGENFIVNDTKEEYYKTFMPTLKENGYKTYLINYKDALNSNGFNPLLVPYKLYKSGNKDLAIDEINNIANELFKNDEAMDPFWQNSASDYLKGLTLLLFEIGKEEEINLGSVGMMLLQAENNKETFDNIVNGQQTFHRAFMTGAMTARGNLKTLRMLDEIFRFQN